MKQSYRRWSAGLLAGFLAVLTLSAGTVWAVDPFFHYHDPDPEGEVWFDERYQNAGLLRSQQYETVLMGTSLAENYRPFWFDVFYKTSTVKAAFPNGGFHEFSQALDYAFERQDVKRVIFGLDPNILARPAAQAPDQLPAYLYDDDPWNDGAYLFSKDVLLRAGYALAEKERGRTCPLQDAFMWDGTESFSREDALAGYDRPDDPAARPLPEDAFSAACAENLAVVTGWLESHPDTQFVFYLAPYSILFWDKMQRLGETDAMFALLRRTAETLLPYENAELHCFLDDMDVILDLDNYSDHIHAAGRVTYAMAEALPGGAYRLTPENARQRLDALHEFVVNYDYEPLFQP